MSQAQSAAPPSLPDDATILTRLVQAGEHVFAMRVLSFPDALAETIEHVRTVCRRPHETVRIIDGHTLLAAEIIGELNRILGTSARNAAPIYCQIVGVLLPHLRTDLSRALAARAQARPTP